MIDDEQLWGGEYGRIKNEYAQPQRSRVSPLLIASATAGEPDGLGAGYRLRLGGLSINTTANPPWAHRLVGG